MSVDHKRPLFAFVIVAVACAAIIANGIRSEALVAMMRTGASHIVAGIVFEPDRDRAQPPAEAAAPAPAVEVHAPAAPVVAGHPDSRAAHRPAPAGSGRHSSGRHDGRDHRRARWNEGHGWGATGHGSARGPGRRHGHGYAPKDGEHGQGQRHDQGYGHGHGHGHDYGYGHAGRTGRDHEGHGRHD